MSESVLPMFSSRSFMVSGFTFRSLIHFEFIFVYGVRKCSSFILLQEVGQFSQNHLLKDSLFSIAYSCLLCQRQVSIGVWIYLWAFYFVPLIDISTFALFTCLFNLPSSYCTPLATVVFLYPKS